MGATIQHVSKCVKGNHLYTLWERIPDEPDEDSYFYVTVSILKNDPGFGWGHKTMSESEGPYYFACPALYLDERRYPRDPNVIDRYGPGWREKCRETAALAKKHRAERKRLKTLDGWAM